MAVVYSTSLKNTRMNAVVAAIGAGGTLVIGTSALAGATGVLVTVPLAATAATVSNGVLTLSGVPLTATSTATGVAAKAEIRSSSGAVVTGLTVGTSGTDVTINATSISIGQTVQVTSGVITHG